MDELLKQYNLKYEDLNAPEKETLKTMLASMKQNVLTTDRIREYIHSMKEAVEQELTQFGLGSKQDLFLKARLRNYILLESFLQTPEKAKKQLELAIKGIQ